MFTWNVEEMKLLNQKGGLFLGKEKVYREEYEVSSEDKIAFVDQMQGGKLSYVLNLAEKFSKDRPYLPKDYVGGVTVNAMRGWCFRNDNRNILANYTERFRLLGCDRSIQNISRTLSNDVYSDFVDEVFHRQLKECEKAERKYFEEHDEYCILRKTVFEKLRKFGTSFGVHIFLPGNNRMTVARKEMNMKGRYDDRDLTMEELRELDEKYNQLEDFIDKLSAETNIVY